MAGMNWRQEDEKLLGRSESRFQTLLWQMECEDRCPINNRMLFMRMSRCWKYSLVMTAGQSTVDINKTLRIKWKHFSHDLWSAEQKISLSANVGVPLTSQKSYYSHVWCWNNGGSKMSTWISCENKRQEWLKQPLRTGERPWPSRSSEVQPCSDNLHKNMVDTNKQSHKRPPPLPGANITWFFSWSHGPVLQVVCLFTNLSTEPQNRSVETYSTLPFNNNIMHVMDRTRREGKGQMNVYNTAINTHLWLN